jgi:hypothetical protein
MARHSDRGITKSAKSLLRHGFLSPLPPVDVDPSKVALGMAPPPSTPISQGLIRCGLKFGVDSGQAS